MRVFYRSVQSGERRSLVYRQGRVEFCCAAMCRWWGLLIGFGARGRATSTDRDVNLFLDRPQVNGRSVVELVAIGFCRFCGQPVETCRVKG